MRLLLISGIVTFLPFAALAEPAKSDSDAIIQHFVTATQAPAQRLHGASMEVAFSAELPKLKKSGHLQALRKISELGRITYEAIRFEGDSTIKKDVIARYMTAETQGRDERYGSVAVTPENYKFKYKGLTTVDGRQAHHFELSPRKKRLGLFKGELLIDAETYLTLRESGRFVKNPSLFLKSVDFVREYDIRDGVAIPRRIDSKIETRIVGKAELSISYVSVKLSEQGPSSLIAGGN